MFAMRAATAGLAVGLVLVGLVPPAAHGEGVDETPLPVKLVRAFPHLKLRRPTVITHAGDGTNRLFVVTQQGVISVFPNDQEVKEAKIFLDIEKRVVYKDHENEEGLLGLAFHPRFKENGHFFVYYTTADGPPHTSILSRFRVGKSDPDKADPNSEEVLMRIPQPFWNHNGGGIQFGPDGYLYIGLGDGGAANDPLKNGQKLSTVLGKILRIDVDRQADGKAYAIPRDNPFVGRPMAAPEIWAYGLRNPWGIHFDPKTGKLWCADVGQDLWEEIDLIEKGGNYGWNLREGRHKFPGGSDERPDLIEPIWEYHHSVGKSITGGAVYRGSRLPLLEGMYLYGDYVSGRVWALAYDATEKRTVANHTIEAPTMPYSAVGTDEKGEVYFADVFGQLWMPQAADTILFKEDFEAGATRWEPIDPAQWKHKAIGKEQHVYSQFEKKTSYKPPHRSPTNIALLKDLVIGDFELKARVLSTHPDYGHRDAVLVFGYQDPTRFYYVHLGKQADDHANQVFIVNGAPRTKISLTSTPGTNWDDQWHNVKIVRKVADGTIEIYFDDMEKPMMTAKDKTFAWGRIGIGTFDDTSDWDDIELRGVKVERTK
jgi:quinoprotein glucose dehydrogenase